MSVSVCVRERIYMDCRYGTQTCSCNRINWFRLNIRSMTYMCCKLGHGRYLGNL